MVLSGKEEEALKVLNTLHEKEEAQKEIDEIKLSLNKERKTQLKGASVLQKSVNSNYYNRVSIILITAIHRNKMLFCIMVEIFF